MFSLFRDLVLGHVETVPMPISNNLFLNFEKLTFLEIDCFAGFRVPQPFVSVSQLPAALRLPQKKHAPGILEHVSCGFCGFLSIS